MKKDIDIVCVGEVLIDFIGNQIDKSISQTNDYKKHLGGSPTNVAMHMSRMGLKIVLVAALGNDGLGDYILKKLNTTQIDTTAIQKIKNKSTSNIIVSRSSSTPEFIPYRAADYQIKKKQISNALLKRVKIFHTTCFALSKNPARKTILSKAKNANKYNCTLSIDINYSSKIWSSKAKALKVIKQYCKFNPLVKISMDDVQRLFGEEFTVQQVFDFFHKQNVSIVCLTLGNQGVQLSQKNKEIISLPAIQIDKIVDVTGAGDAFWSGFLATYSKEYSLEKCLENALKLAALKLQNVGSHPKNIDFLKKI